jgi:hypothetical protein
MDRVVHLTTISYPWDATGKVTVFVVRMKYEYFIIAMAVVPQLTSEPYLLRALYASENLYSDKEETIEVFERDKQFILRVTTDSGGAYSGIPLPSTRLAIVSHHFLPSDADYELFIVKESTSTTSPSGFITSPNVALVFTANIAAYYPSGYMRCGSILDYGHRIRADHTMTKILMWLSYTHRSRRNEPFFGGGQLMDELSKTYDMVYEDPVYDDGNPIFPSALATAANLDILSKQTVLIDDFLRHLHRSDAQIIANSRSISCSLPVVCRARPTGALSLMRHITFFNFKIVDLGGIDVSHKALKAKRPLLEFREPAKNVVLRLGIKAFIILRSHFYRFVQPQKRPSRPKTTLALPLEGFSSYESQILKAPATVHSRESESSLVFFDLASYAYYNKHDEARPSSVFRAYPPNFGRRDTPTSPFSSLVEETFLLNDSEL